MATYKINPLKLANNLAGIGIQDLFQYKPGVEAILYDDGTSDNVDYFNALNNGLAYDMKEFRLSTKNNLTNAQGIIIADRWIEFKPTEEDTYLIEAPLMRLSRTKIINKTNIYGYEGTIKEFVATSDWVIDFTFAIVGKRKYELDYDELGSFLDLDNLRTSININSPFLNHVFSIDKVIIDSVNSINEHDIYKNILYVNMTLLSDEDYEPFEKETTE